MALLRWLTFLLLFLTVTLKVQPFLIYFFLTVFPPLGNSDHAVVSVSINFPTNLQRDAPFHRIAFDYFDYSFDFWDSLRDHLRDIPSEDVFKLSASATASEFCK